MGMAPTTDSEVVPSVSPYTLVFAVVGLKLAFCRATPRPMEAKKHAPLEGIECTI